MIGGVESAPDRNDPTRTLARFLIRAVVAGSNVKSKEMTTTREMYVKCLLAWNAHRRGDTTSLAYHANAEIPKILK